MRAYRGCVYPACGARRCWPVHVAKFVIPKRHGRIPGLQKGACMKSWIGCLTLITAASGALAAADLGAGKAKAEAVCSACHGLNGVSVTDAIPNLAGQKAAYL